MKPTHTPRRSIRVPPQVWEAAKREAERRGETVTDAVVRFLRRYGRPGSLSRMSEPHISDEPTTLVVRVVDRDDVVWAKSGMAEGSLWWGCGRSFPCDWSELQRLRGPLRILWSSDTADAAGASTPPP